LRIRIKEGQYELPKRKKNNYDVWGVGVGILSLGKAGVFFRNLKPFIQA
jgi:hypothetical protein